MRKWLKMMQLLLHWTSIIQRRTLHSRMSHLYSDCWRQILKPAWGKIPSEWANKRILEDYFRVRPILALLKVHLRAKNWELGFFVNEDSHPVLIHHFILRLFCLRIVESVTQTCPQKRQVFIWQRPFLPLHPRVRTPILRPSAPGWAAVNVLILVRKRYNDKLKGTGTNE